MMSGNLWSDELYFCILTADDITVYVVDAEPVDADCQGSRAPGCTCRILQLTPEETN